MSELRCKVDGTTQSHRQRRDVESRRAALEERLPFGIRPRSPGTAAKAAHAVRSARVNGLDATAESSTLKNIARVRAAQPVDEADAGLFLEDESAHALLR